MDATITFTVNGRQRSVTTDPARPLLEVLREDLQLTGTKYGCGEGRCGACTVLLDGKRTFSCRTEVEDVSGKAVTTVEGLAEGEQLHPVQEAFLEEAASQCGYCTPGMIMASISLLKENPDATEQEIREGLEGNLCRCTGYENIVRAVKYAASQMQGATEGASPMHQGAKPETPELAGEIEHPQRANGQPDKPETVEEWQGENAGVSDETR